MNRQERSPLLIRGSTVFTPGRRLEKAVLLLEGGKISFLGQGAPPRRLPPSTRRLDLPGRLIAPGFIDLHVHGAKGVDFTDTAPSGWVPALKYHIARGGTTAFLATLMSAPRETLLSRLNEMAERRSGQYGGGALCLGAHLEGPYLNPRKKGVHPLHALRYPSAEETESYLQSASGQLRMLTLAPELAPNQDLIRNMESRGVLTAAGHTLADYNTARKSFEAGLRYTVHTCNAMAPLHHREPGILGAALEDERVFCEVIADGHHLHPSILRLLYKVKGWRRLVLATDSSPLNGLSDGHYSWQGERVRLYADRTENAQGRLAGSCLTMVKGVRNMLQWSGCTPAQALAMASANPAALLGLKNKGRIAKGKDADLVVLTPQLDIQTVLIGGVIVWP